jgi:hypothetical protein
LLTLASSAGAQFNQYTLPGGPEERPGDNKAKLERDVEEARFRLGALRIAPWFTLQDVAYVRNLFAGEGETESDLTATAGAGFRAYLRTGSKMTWIAQVLPEYVWWADQEDRRNLNGRYGLETFGYFNRLTLEAAAGRDQRQRVVTSEVTEPVSSREDSARLLTEVRVSGAFSVLAAASLRKETSLVEDLDDPRTRSLALLDREERVSRAGLRWRPRKAWLIGLGAERSDVEFEPGALDRSNGGTSPTLELQVDRRRLFVKADLVARSLAPREGSGFVDYDGVTGNVGLSFASSPRIDYWIYANRSLTYSLSPAYAYLESDRTGASFSVELNRRLTARAFAETGVNDYTIASPTAPPRNDDVLSYGGTLQLTLPWSTLLRFQVLRSEFDSNLPEGDRAYTTGGFTFTVAGSR